MAKQDPALTAEAVYEGIPMLMELARSRAIEEFGVDLTATGWKEQFRREQHTVAEAGMLLLMANNYLVCSWCKTKLNDCVADKTLSNEERAARICEVGVEALRAMEAALQHNLHEFLGATSGNAEAEAYARNVLALRLGGYVSNKVQTISGCASALGSPRVTRPY